MEAIILAGGKAERMGDATGGRPKSLVEVADRPLVGYQIARLAEAGVERVIVSCAAGPGELFTEALADLGPEIVCAEEPGGGRRLRAERRRARRRRLRRAARPAPLDRGSGDGRGRPSGLAVRGRRARRGRRDHGVPGGRPDPLLGELRRVRLLRGGDRAPARSRRPRDDDLPRARRRGTAARLPARRALADGEHAEGAPPRAGTRVSTSRMARGVGSPRLAERLVVAELDRCRALR